MKQYYDYLDTIMSEGTIQANRTGVKALTTNGLSMRFDLQQGFPATTLKSLAMKPVIGELLGFIRARTNAKDFRELGCKIWDGNANSDGVDPEGNIIPNKWLTNPARQGEDDLGLIYGAMWRHWPNALESNNGLFDGSIDQLATCIQQILTDPTNRRIIFSAWRPDLFPLMALPPCHVLYQFIVNVETNELNLCMYQRSADSFLGVPFNIASASLLLSLVARLTGYTPKRFTHFIGDAHIYVNHLAQVATMLSREPKALPTLVLSEEITELPKHATQQEIDYALHMIEPRHIWLENYDPHPALKGAMAV